MDRTGLGNQTRNLARMIRPDEIMLINSKPFNGNEQYPDTYAQYSVTEIMGFPSNVQIREWLRGVDVVITCEVFYNNLFVDIAKEMGVKTINQYNWEFADYLRDPNLTLPDKLISPSKWHIDEAQQKWRNVEYLPAPVFIDDYAEVREHNMARTGRKRFLHPMGRAAVNDRNGTNDLIQAMRYSGEDFELVIKAQVGEVINKYNDPRITILHDEPDNEVELYRDFDAVILPRRYGGQCLPMTEALCAGMPVIMTDVSPNNEILPKHWLVQTTAAGRFMTRTYIDLCTVNHAELGQRLDFVSKKDLQGDKKMAYNIGYREFSNYELEGKWDKLIHEVNSQRENSIEDNA
jgi:glycosyltransferase involved in cell wall biosynthesis